MKSRLAPLHDKTVIYYHLPLDKVLLLKDNYKYKVIMVETFNHLFIELSSDRAVLKEDCIEYTIYYPGKPLALYPEWYIEAFDNGLIFEDEKGNFLCHDNQGFINVMTPGSIVLVNYLGQVKNMDIYEFKKFYDVRGL